jgi:hypothetical protein
MEKLRLDLVQQAFTFLALGQVAHEADELPLPFKHDLPDREFHRECTAILALAHDDTSDADDAPLSGR